MAHAINSSIGITSADARSASTPSYQAYQILRAGFIDRLIVTRVPVLIGTGIPLFGPVESDIVLRHVATRQYASGLVQSEYELARHSA